ncbi:hypothetical protein PoB_007025500 [Plakobranchus ocellatus]|uniref:Uncharacterized protein n=1 Tax=Plakobranchus ocellatus TaxID=259542 RepID=A0AAV4DHZ1_9GAST|nr:hypothetical protein PoB_007025500 [Plakobranchus ocellatus]
MSTGGVGGAVDNDLALRFAGTLRSWVLPDDRREESIREQVQAGQDHQSRRPETWKQSDAAGVRVAQVLVSLSRSGSPSESMSEDGKFRAGIRDTPESGNFHCSRLV